MLCAYTMIHICARSERLKPTRGKQNKSIPSVEEEKQILAKYVDSIWKARSINLVWKFEIGR